MINSHSYYEKFKAHNACIILPTYNNAGTLGTVITGVLAYTDQVIVVNDGSTDDTEKIIRSFPAVQLVSYEKNVGKGWALRQGFKYAIAHNYRFAITIDSDGQHFAKDIPAFLDKLDTVQDAVIIGSRNMNQDSVPGKSSFGHKFSNFWYKIETGIDCPDTQSGYRSYPLHLMRGMKFFTWKYEFEIEVIVRAAWKGIKMDAVPVTVYYAPKETRISHFRPFKDFSRVSVLNTVLVFITFLYIKPRNFFRFLTQKRKVKAFVREQLFNPNETIRRKTLSIGFGVFMGIVPLWGFQLAIAIALSFLFKLNKALVVLAAHISIPPMIPFIVFLSYKMGGVWIHEKGIALEYSHKLDLKMITQHLEQYLYGSISLAIIAGIAAGLAALIVLKLVKKKPVVTA